MAFHSQIFTEHLLYDVDVIFSKNYKQEDISIAPETLVTVAALTASGVRDAEIKSSVTNIQRQCLRPSRAQEILLVPGCPLLYFDSINLFEHV